MNPKTELFINFRSLTPFLRSQGRADGHGLVFHSRISPSPNRSLHRRRRHKPSRASVDSDSLSETGDRMSRRSIREEMAVRFLSPFFSIPPLSDYFREARTRLTEVLGGKTSFLPL